MRPTGRPPRRRARARMEPLAILPLFFKLAGTPRRRRRRQRGGGLEGRAALRGGRHGRGVGRPDPCAEHGGACRQRRRTAQSMLRRAVVEGADLRWRGARRRRVPLTRTKPPASMAAACGAGVPVNVIDRPALLHVPVRRHRQPLAAGRRHLDGRRRAGVRPGDPLAHRGAAARRLRALGRRRAGVAGGDCRPEPGSGRAAAVLGGGSPPCALRAPDRAPTASDRDGSCETARQPARECAGAATSRWSAPGPAIRSC